MPEPWNEGVMENGGDWGSKFERGEMLLLQLTFCGTNLADKCQNTYSDPPLTIHAFQSEPIMLHKFSLGSLCSALIFTSTVTLMLTPTVVSQVVQLPSMRNFSYSGGALVPDQGSAVMAGNAYASSGSVSSGWGPYGTRASGHTFGTSVSSASVQIIDLRALDDAILGSNVVHSNNGPSAPQAIVNAASPPRRSLVGGGVNAAAITPLTDPGKWQRVLAGGQPTVPVHTSLAEADIRFYLKMGQDAEAANRLMSARVYYRMAVDSMTPEMQVRYAKIISDRKEAAAAEVAAAKAAGRQRF